MCEAVGIQALTVHCRTRDQGHQGHADYSWIPRIKEAVTIPIIVNGSILTPQDVKDLFVTTGCDAVMIGRGAVMNPWIFQQAKHFMVKGELPAEPTLRERVALLQDQLKLSVDLKGERVGVIELRKYYSGYLRGLPHIAKTRSELMQLTDATAVRVHLSEFLERNDPDQSFTSAVSHPVAA
jgi:tRNA-dihydrouridine synthase B